MERTFRDLALALRGLRISPGFTLATISTLALGIGANAAVFSVVNGVLIKPLPYRQPTELIHARYTAPGIGFPEFGLSGLDYVQFNERARSVTDFAVFAVQNVDLAGDNEEPERLAAAQTSGNFFDVLGIPPRIGRTLQPDDELGASADVVVLSHAFWVRRFGADQAILGRTMRLDGVTREIVGVMPARFGFPAPETDVWLPVSLDAILSAPAHSFSAVARMRPGVAHADVLADFQAVIEQLPHFPESFRSRARLAPLVQPLHAAVVGDIAPALWMLLGTVGFILLIACANVANLFLLRAEGNQHDRAVRQALGASWRDLTRSHLTESALLAAIAGGVGLAVAMVALPVRRERREPAATGPRGSGHLWFPSRGIPSRP